MDGKQDMGRLNNIYVDVYRVHVNDSSKVGIVLQNIE